MKQKDIYTPSGIHFVDRVHGPMILEQSDREWNGWLHYQHPDGYWVSLRYATADDKLKVEISVANSAATPPTETPAKPKPICLNCGYPNAHLDSHSGRVLCPTCGLTEPNSNPPTEAAMAAAREIHFTRSSGSARVVNSAAIIDRHFSASLASIEGERDAAKIELGAARSGIIAWIGDIQSFNVALGLIPAAHRTETLEAIVTLRAELVAAKALFERHTKAVGEFLNELYAISCDPLADGTMEVSEMKAALLEAAKRDLGLRADLAAKGELLGEGTSWPVESLYKALVIAETKFREDGRDFDGWECIQSVAAVAQQRLSALAARASTDGSTGPKSVPTPEKNQSGSDPASPFIDQGEPGPGIV